MELLFLLLPSALAACTLLRASEELTSDTVSLAWSSSPECSQGRIKRYEVQWQHVKYLACPDGRQDQASLGVKDGLVTTQTEIQNLHPHSLYEFIIKATSRDGSVIPTLVLPLTTKMAAPSSQPRREDGGNEPLKTNIRFYWDEPEQCELQHGQRKEYQVELEGLDPWDKGVKRLDSNTVIDKSFLAHELQSFSSYRLKVYNTNYEPQTGRTYVNEVEPLLIQERTLPTSPLAPVSLVSSSQTESSVFLSWSPAFPPTGQVSGFSLHVTQLQDGGQEGLEWDEQLGVTHLCKDNPQNFCYSVQSLQPNTSYRFKLRAWNAGVSESSLWSSSLEQMTEGDAVPLVTTLHPPAVPSVPSPTTSSGSPSLVIILSTMGAILVLVVFIVFLYFQLKFSRLKQQIRNEEQWNGPAGQLSHSSSYLPGPSVSTHLADSYLTSLERSGDLGSLRSSADIQTRRLPQPPQALEEGQYAETYELVPVPGVFLPTSPLESTRIQGQEEVTDVEGYLRPTFAERGESPILHREGGEEIPAESYGEAGGGREGSFRAGGGRDGSERSRGSSISPSQPLISPAVSV